MDNGIASTASGNPSQSDLCTQERPTFHGNRESWCTEIVRVMLPMLAEHGITLPEGRKVRCAVTAGISRNALGLCHPTARSADGVTNFIDVSTAQAEPVDLAHTILHELLHACDDCQSGHKGRWRRWADLIGIARRGHETRGPIATQIIDTALDTVGIPVEHVATTRKITIRRISQIKYWCVGHGHAHVPTSQAVAGFQMFCGKCGKVMDYDLDALMRAT